MAPTVAVIGVGAMGAPMARRLVDAGFEVALYDRDAAALAAFEGTGASIAASPAECARCEVVLVLVATGAQIRDVVLGESGVVAGALEGHPPTVVVMGTVPRADVVQLQAAVSSQGIAVVDAPVSGGPLRAAEGSLTIIIGGEDGDVAAVRPVFEVLGANLFQCGPVGSAQTVKIVNNIVGQANAMITAEAYRLGIENGLDPEELRVVLEVSSGRNFLTAKPGEAATSYAAWAPSEDAFHSLLRIIRKDLGMALDMTKASSGSFPVLARLKGAADDLAGETFETWRVVAQADGGED